jgi:hypothetical protein
VTRGEPHPTPQLGSGAVASIADVTLLGSHQVFVHGIRSQREEIEPIDAGPDLIVMSHPAEDRVHESTARPGTVLVGEAPGPELDDGSPRPANGSTGSRRRKIRLGI